MMDKKTKPAGGGFFSRKLIIIFLVLVIIAGGMYVWYTSKPKSAEKPADAPQVLSFSRMKRDTIYLLRPGDIIKIKDETPNTTRAISFTPAIAETYEMEYFPDRKKWHYTLPSDITSGQYLVTVVTKDNKTGKIVKTKEVEISIDKNSGKQIDIVDPED